MKTERFDEELRYRAILAMSLIVCAIASIIVLEHKAGYFIDEYLSLMRASMYNLQTAQAQAIASASDRADLDCIVVTDTKKNWPLLAMLECKPEAGQYASLTFVDSQDPSDLRNFADRDELMLFIDSSVNEQDVQKLAAAYGLPDSVEYIYAYTSFTSYHLTRDTTT